MQMNQVEHIDQINFNLFLETDIDDLNKIELLKTNGNNKNNTNTSTTTTTITNTTSTITTTTSTNNNNNNKNKNINENYNLCKTAFNQRNQPKYKKNSKIVPYTHIQLNKSNTKASENGNDDSKNTVSGFKVVAKYFYTCHKCNLDFNSLKVYQQHLLTHGQTPGLNKVFILQNLFYSFIFQETNICCHICGKAFANTRNLNVHLRLHTGFRPFECEMCKRKFTSIILKNYSRINKYFEMIFCQEKKIYVVI